MILTRRRVLTGLLAAPLIVRTAGLLMPIKPWRPKAAVRTVTYLPQPIDGRTVTIARTDGGLLHVSQNFPPEAEALSTYRHVAESESGMVQYENHAWELAPHETAQFMAAGGTWHRIGGFSSHPSGLLLPRHSPVFVGAEL
jgi:hypothetical protein